MAVGFHHDDVHAALSRLTPSDRPSTISPSSAPVLVIVNQFWISFPAFSPSVFVSVSAAILLALPIYWLLGPRVDPAVYLSIVGVLFLIGAWACDVTGSGASRWTVEPAADAPSKPNVVKQSGVGDFPWCALKSASLADGYVEVKFKALSGKIGLLH